MPLQHARARPAAEVHGPGIAAAIVRKRAPLALAPEERKQKVNSRLSPDVPEDLRDSGPGWQARADAILREGLGLKQTGRCHDGRNLRGKH